MYQTDDLFEAASIILETKEWHKTTELKDDVLEQRVFFCWETDHSEIGQKFKNNELRVCPRSLAKVYATLKKITFKVKANGGHHNEPR